MFVGGDTLIHEVGHWLGLYHVFQDGCNSNAVTGGDRVADTPAQTMHFSCNKQTDTCPQIAGKDDVENYMGYGSVTRWRCSELGALVSSFFRRAHAYSGCLDLIEDHL